MFRNDSLPCVRRTSVGGSTARRPLSTRSSQHPGVLQHQVLHAADSREPPRTVVLQHLEAVEEEQYDRWQANTQCLPSL